jgi:tetratricopeptide (TPR) repeat protein
MKKTLFGVAFFVLLVLMVELVLGLFPLEEYDHLFVQRSSHPFFIPGAGEHVDDYVTNPHFSYQLNFQAFPRRKGEGVKRIFILGGSAAYGFPYSAEYGFSGYLQRALAREAPGKYEIVNAAAMSFGSHRVFDELRDLVNYAPDLVIINSGNNEYVEKNILPAGHGHEKPLERLSGFLGRSETYRAVRLGLFKISPKSFQRQVAPDLTDIRSARVVRRAGMVRSSETEREVLANYRQNLLAMKQLLAEKGIRGIFTTVPTNLAHWVPVSNPPRFAQRHDQDQWRELQDKVATGLATARPEEREKFIELERLLLETLRYLPEHADSYYDLGRVRMALGQYDSAYEALVRARDLDGKPVRALSVFNDSVRELFRDDRGFELVDLDAAIGGVIRTGMTEGIFLDYCHYTQEGHKFIAISLLPAIQKALGPQLPIARLEGHIHADAISPAHDARLMAMEFYARGMTYLNNGSFEEARGAFLKVLEIYPNDDPVFRSSMMDNLAVTCQAIGNKEEAKKYYLLALATDPANMVALLEVGQINLEEGKLGEAAELFNRLIKLNAYSPDAYDGLGQVALRHGRIREAVDHFEKTVKLGGGNALVYKGLAKAYLASGEYKRGEEALLKAREFDPFDQEIDRLLGEAGRVGGVVGR